MEAYKDLRLNRILNQAAPINSLLFYNSCRTTGSAYKTKWNCQIKGFWSPDSYHAIGWWYRIFYFFFVDDKDKGVGISVVNFWNADTKKTPQLSARLNTARGNCLSRLPFHNINTLHTAPRTPNESKYQMADFARVLQYVIGAALTLTLANVEGSSSLSFTA